MNKVHVCVIDTDKCGTFTTAHATRRGGLNAVANWFEMDVSGMDDDEAAAALLDRSQRGSDWFIVEECEIEP
jgi:hypothetical protein